MNGTVATPETAPFHRPVRTKLIETRPSAESPLTRVMNSVNVRAAGDLAKVIIGPQAVAFGIGTILPSVLDGVSIAMPESSLLLQPVTNILRASNPALQQMALGVSGWLLFG